MNKTPLNYLVTIAIASVLWVITAIFYGGTFSESLMLAVSTPEDFLANLRIMLGVAAGIGLLNCLYWYYYGAKDSTAGRLDRAKKVWWSSFILQIVGSVGILVTLVIMNIQEGILTTDWLIVYGLISVHTWFLFWLCTFIMSPRTVKYIPLFK